MEKVGGAFCPAVESWRLIMMMINDWGEREKERGREGREKRRERCVWGGGERKGEEGKESAEKMEEGDVGREMG